MFSGRPVNQSRYSIDGSYCYYYFRPLFATCHCCSVCYSHRVCGLSTWDSLPTPASIAFFFDSQKAHTFPAPCLWAEGWAYQIPTQTRLYVGNQGWSSWLWPWHVFCPVCFFPQPRKCSIPYLVFHATSWHLIDILGSSSFGDPPLPPILLRFPCLRQIHSCTLWGLSQQISLEGGTLSRSYRIPDLRNFFSISPCICGTSDVPRWWVLYVIFPPSLI